MKVAILGNMNNNGFAIMRYLLDQGVDVNLILFDSDNLKGSEHFDIEKDTWYKEKYKKNVKNINISIGPGALLSNTFFGFLLATCIYLFKIFTKSSNPKLWKPLNTWQWSFLKKELSQYKFLIGSTVFPSILNSIQRNITVFFPYSIGCEYVNESYFYSYVKSKNIFISKIANRIRNSQISGIQNAIFVISSDRGVTSKVLLSIGVEYIYGYLPIVYVENVISDLYPKALSSVIREINKYDIVMMSHSRHIWVNTEFFDKNIWSNISKNNNWIIEAFSDFKQKNSNIKALLVFFEYGKDVVKSKELCSKLNIEKNVLWLPLMPRKNILELIKHIDIGIGEFYKNPTAMGGAQLEYLSKGKPLISGPMDAGIISPVLQCNNKKEIYESMNTVSKNVKLSDEISLKSKEWFDKEAGSGAANRIIKLMNSISN